MLDAGLGGVLGCDVYGVLGCEEVGGQGGYC